MLRRGVPRGRGRPRGRGGGGGGGSGSRRRRGGALATEIVRPVPTVGAATGVDAADAYHLEVGVQHVGVVPGRVLPEVERARGRVGARGRVLALPGVVAVAEGGQ